VLTIFALLMIGLGGVMAWQAVEYFTHAYARRAVSAPPVAAPNPGLRGAAWERGVLAAFDQAAQQVKSGDVTTAEMDVDQAVAEMEEARVRRKPIVGDFISRAIVKLDAILAAQPSSAAASAPADENDAAGSPQPAMPDLSAGRLAGHVTDARVELAAIRSAQNPIPPGTVLASDAAAQAGNAAAATANLPAPAETSAKLNLPEGHVVPDGPRELAANQTLDPSSLGGNFLDASLFPDTSEILLPPESRQLSDNVRVENLTIAGASQTLDGIHWRNVTFIGTRLRYEDGPLDLHNVKFIHCTFGFPSDARGASLATAIALGQTTFTIQ
jgi:CBS domain-containing protein